MRAASSAWMLGRHGLREGVGILREHRDQLLDEQRIALRCRDDALVHGRAERLHGDERVDELVGSGGVERFEYDERHAAHGAQPTTGRTSKRSGRAVQRR